MRNLSMFLFAAALAPLVAAQTAQASSVYVVHGIPGRDLGLSADLPVDVSVNGACALPGFTFGTIEGPLELPAGAYDIEIALADAAAPCSRPAVISAPAVTLADGESYAIVAHLSEAGAPTASVFVNDLAPTAGARLSVHHTAAAPAVDILAGAQAGSLGPVAGLTGVTNGLKGDVEVPAGSLSVAVAPAGQPESAAVFGPAALSLAAERAYLVFAVGSLANNTFTVLIKDIDVRTAQVYVLHGIVGDDLGAPTALPVDVRVNGDCLLPGFTFGQFVGPVTLPPGNYDIAVSLASAVPCSSAPVIDAAGVAIQAGTSIIAAHLSEAGAPTASVFQVELNQDRRARRLFAAHTAAAPTVDFQFFARRAHSFGQFIRGVFRGVSNGEQRGADFRRSRSTIAGFIFPAGSRQALGGTRLQVAPGGTGLVFAVGSLSNGTLQFLTPSL